MPAGNCFPFTVSIERKTTDVDAALGQISTYTPVYSYIAASVQPASTTIIDIYSRRNLEVTHMVYTGKAIAVQIGDLVVFGNRQFYVMGFRNLLENGRLYEMTCREIMTTEDIVQSR